jgi:hypothetical protein
LAPTDEAARLAPLNQVSPPALLAAPPVPTWIVMLLLGVSPARLVIFE